MAFLIIDRLGRRTLLLSSLILMFPFLLGTSRWLDTDHFKAGEVISGVLIVIYTALYSFGAGVGFPQIRIVPPRTPDVK